MKSKLTRFVAGMFFLALVFTANILFAQQKTISGKITSGEGTPLQGVTVQLKGTHLFTNSDENGNYTLALSKPGNTLIFSFVGYLSKQENIDNLSSLNVTMQPATSQLNEVVVTALGIKKETRKIGYDVTEVKGADLVKARDVNPITSLTGKVAGLTVGASAEMLTKPQIVMRGNTNVLFVVDGVPINSDTWNISPDDIETYTVLKGANAAALYGFRGQNGAIVITTKKGSKDSKGWNVDFNTSNMMEKGFLTLPQSQTEYGRGTKFVYSYGDVLYDNKQRLPEWGPRFEGQAIKQYDSPYDLTTGIRTATPWTARGKDNINKFMQPGVVSTSNISASASGKNYDMRMSYTHTYQKGMAPNTAVNFDNLGVNAGYNITDRLRAEANINLNVQYSPNIPDASYGPNSYVYMFSVYGSADYDINDLKDIYKGPQGVPNLTQYAPEYGRENSAWFMAKEWFRTHDKTDVYGSVKLSYKISKDLSVALRSQVTTWDQLRTEKVPPSANLNTYLSWYYFGWYGDYREDHRRLVENNTDLLFSYNHTFGGFTLDANAGGSFRSFKYNSSWATTKDLAIPKLYSLSNSINPGLSYSYLANMMVYSGYYSFDLGYKKYFTVSATGRIDNLSTLPKSQRTFFYPSVAVSSVLSDYLNLPKVISFLKVRGSYADVKGGLTSSAIPSAYTAVTGISTGSLLGYGTDLYTSYDGPSYTNQNQYTINSYYNGTTSVNYSSTMANPNLKPFTVKSYELGGDIRFIKNRVGVDVTYFQSVNGPSIYALGLPSSTGYVAHNVNGITSLKKGIEIGLSGSPIKNPNGFSWDVNLNWSTYKETLKSIYGDEPTLTMNGHQYKVGERLDNYYSTKFVRDQAGNIVLNGGLPLSAPSQSDLSNRGLIGHLNPDFTFGFLNTFSYKNISFSFQFDGRIGGKIYDRVYYQGNNGGTSLESASGDFGVARRAEWETAKANGGTLPSSYAGAYIGKGVKITSGTPTYENGQITNFKDLTFAPNDVATTVQSYISSGIGGNFDEYYMVDRSFVKLRQVQLTYNFPTLHSRIFKTASVSLVGRNLLYFAARKDFDIEQYAAGFNIADRSAGGASPDLQSATARRFGFNLNLGF
jgi:TonB-linked SusC/RagA family outer membrane protein